MSVDLGVTASCDCFVTSLSGRAHVSTCKDHSWRMLRVFDGRPDQVSAVLATVYADEARGDERARIVWWLRAGLSGPAAVNTSAETLDHMRELANAIEQHPERFADAPTGRPS